MTEFALFLGCTVPVRCLNYEISARKVCEKFGVKFIDLDDFACCGYPINAVDHTSSLAMAARNLCVAEEKGLNIVTLCNACTSSLTHANRILKENEEEREKINAILKPLGREFKGITTVKHLNRLLYEDVGVDAIKKMIVKPLTGLKIAPHYGCHYLKPSEIYDKFESPIKPESLDKLVEATGATPTEYEEKMQCCGGGILAIDEGVSMKIAKQKLDHVKSAGADAMTLACPSCSIMYDEYQRTIGRRFDVEYKIPALYYPQLLGLALGFDPKKDLALNKNVVKARNLIERFGSK
jgi:heterodisulfide reductase subunit B